MGPCVRRDDDSVWRILRDSSFQTAQDVIASAAKQSTLTSLLLDGLLRCARNDGERHGFAISRHALPEVCHNFRTPEVQRARGNAGCTVHPRSRVQKSGNAHTSIQVHRNHPASPHAMVLRLITCSPRRTGWMTPSPAKLPPPTWHMRRHAGTTRFCRPQESALVSCTSRGHRSPPRVSDVSRNAPLLGTGWGEYRTDFYS